MQVRVGTKVTNPMPNGLAWPAIAISEPVAEQRTVVNRTTQQPVEITVTSADFISLRENLAGEKYVAITTEVVQYGYRPIAMPRFDKVVGLDVTDEGKALPLQSVMDAHAKSYSEWQKANFEARRGTVAVSDL